MVKKVKKRRLKKIVKIYLTIILILIIGIASIYLVTTKLNVKEQIPQENVRTTEEIITSILSYELESGIDKPFLEWINNEYGTNILEQLETYLKEKEYNYSIWHQLTSNSLT